MEDCKNPNLEQILGELRIQLSSFDGNNDKIYSEILSLIKLYLQESSIESSNKRSRDVLDDNNAATTIQTWWKGVQKRKQYGIKQLPTKELRNNPTFVVGNDPKIQGLDPYTVKDSKIALIGTSGLRALYLTLELGKGPTPKLIIVDNSQLVIQFWRALRKTVENTTFRDETHFISVFKEFLAQNSDSYRHPTPNQVSEAGRKGIAYENQDPVLYIQELLKTYGLEKVVKVIKHASILQQTWTDPKLFAVLKNICELNGVTKIVAYPSNIAHFVLDSDMDKVFNSIGSLSPFLSIITDRCPVHRIPEHVTLSTDKSPETIKHQVEQNSLSNSTPTPEMSALEISLASYLIFMRSFNLFEPEPDVQCLSSTP